MKVGEALKRKRHCHSERSEESLAISFDSVPVTLSDGSQIPNVRFENGTMDETLEDGPITNAKSLRLGAILSVGYDITMNDRAVIAPMFTYDLPLTTIRDDLATGWKIASLYGSVELKYKFN